MPTQRSAIARGRAGRPAFYEVDNVTLHDIDGDRPYVTFSDSAGRLQRVDADVIAGRDGSHGPSRSAMPQLRRVITSDAAAGELAENYSGLPVNEILNFLQPGA